jgi:hypothetical protein
MEYAVHVEAWLDHHLERADQGLPFPAMCDAYLDALADDPWAEVDDLFA